MAGQKGRSGRKANGEQAPRNIVYQITHIPTGRVYIGSTSYTLNIRMSMHKSRPRASMANDLNANGWNDFEVTILGHYPNHTRDELYAEERTHLMIAINNNIPTYNTHTPGNQMVRRNIGRNWSIEQKAEQSKRTRERVARNGMHSTKKQNRNNSWDIAASWGWSHIKVMMYFRLLGIPTVKTCKYIANPEGINHAITMQVMVEADPENFPFPISPPDFAAIYPQYKA